jgi:hypothetical protein
VEVIFERAGRLLPSMLNPQPGPRKPLGPGIDLLYVPEGGTFFALSRETGPTMRLKRPQNGRDRSPRRQSPNSDRPRVLATFRMLRDHRQSGPPSSATGKEDGGCYQSRPCAPWQNRGKVAGEAVSTVSAAGSVAGPRVARHDGARGQNSPRWHRPSLRTATSAPGRDLSASGSARDWRATTRA